MALPAVDTMADSLQTLPSLSPGVKRTHDGLPVTSGLELTPQTTNNSSTRDVTPVPSRDSSPLSELTATTPQRPESMNPAAPPTKKPKLTFAEKQTELAIQRLVKEEKAKQKAEEKARKEEERAEEKRKKAEEKEAVKRQKEMEKAEKEAERIEKQKAKDAEKAKRESEKAAEQARKEAEKAKKERVS